MNKLKTIVLSMMKIGVIGFGGGNALIPVIQKDVVENKKLISRDEFEEDIIIANITPGALPVELAGGIGKRTTGKKGMLLGALAMAFPGVFLTVLCLSLLSGLSSAVLRQIEFLTVGVTAFITCLLTEYVVGAFENRNDGKNIKVKSFVIIVCVFILTCGKNLFRILHIDAQPFFSLATVNVFIMAFFAIFYTNCIFTKRNSFIVGVICVLYTVCVGKNQMITSKAFQHILEIIMLVFSLYGIKKNLGHREKNNDGVIKEIVSEIIFLLAFVSIFLIAAYLVTDKSLIYVGKGFLSSIMSFGGGDAYLTVADGLFVNETMISEDAFYSRIVPIVNVLPGSILCKTLSGIGYYIGYENSGSVLGGYIVALSGFVCSVSASVGVFSIIGCLAGKFEKLESFRMVKKWIRTIVSGLLLTVILSLIYQNCKLGQELGQSFFPVGCMIGVYLLDLFFYFKFKMQHGWIVLISAIMSCMFCNLMM